MSWTLKLWGMRKANLRAGPFELVGRTLPKFLEEFCADGDALVVLKLQNGMVVLQNSRSHACYFVNADPDEAQA